MVLRRASGSSTADIYLASVDSAPGRRLHDYICDTPRAVRSRFRFWAFATMLGCPSSLRRRASALRRSQPPLPPPASPDPPAGAVAETPTGLMPLLTGLNQIASLLAAIPGCFVVHRADELGWAHWSAVGGAVTSTFVTESGLDYSTTYDYRVLAVSSAGSSPASSAVTATTLAQPPDVLSAQSLIIKVTRRTAFTVPVAGITDANTAAPRQASSRRSNGATEDPAWRKSAAATARSSSRAPTYTLKTGVYKIASDGDHGATAASPAHRRRAPRLVRNPVKHNRARYRSPVT